MTMENDNGIRVTETRGWASAIPAILAAVFGVGALVALVVYGFGSILASAPYVSALFLVCIGVLLVVMPMIYIAGHRGGSSDTHDVAVALIAAQQQMQRGQVIDVMPTRVRRPPAVLPRGLPLALSPSPSVPRNQFTGTGIEQHAYLPASDDADDSSDTVELCFQDGTRASLSREAMDRALAAPDLRRSSLAGVGNDAQTAIRRYAKERNLVDATGTWTDAGRASARTWMGHGR